MKKNKARYSNNAWNHSTVYHPWILSHIKKGDSVLDIGSGDGILEWKLASNCKEVIGLEPDQEMIDLSIKRCNQFSNVSFVKGIFEEFDIIESRFDVIVFSASLHHMNHEEGLKKAIKLLRPEGILLIVGFAARKTIFDKILNVMRRFPARLGAKIHGEVHGVAPISYPELNSKEIRALSKKILPGMKMRQGLYYRYLLTWKKPNTQESKRSY